MSKGLQWNGYSNADIPIVFLPLTISSNWAAATSTSTADTDYDLFGPQVFRFEYRYLLKNDAFSVTPWNTAAGSTKVNGLRDVAAITVAIGVIDPKSRILVSDTQLATLIGSMNDFDAAGAPGALEKQWQTAVLASGLPQPVTSSIRIYSRSFYLSTPTASQ